MSTLNRLNLPAGPLTAAAGNENHPWPFANSNQAPRVPDAGARGGPLEGGGGRRACGASGPVRVQGGPSPGSEPREGGIRPAGPRLSCLGRARRGSARGSCVGCGCCPHTVGAPQVCRLLTCGSQPCISYLEAGPRPAALPWAPSASPPTWSRGCGMLPYPVPGPRGPP